MNILLVYPKCPDSFWNFRHALKFISKKAAVPPLGLTAVSAMLPATWEKKLADLTAGHPQRIYATDEYADLKKTPVPDYHLLSVKDYAYMNIQVTRGCPYPCNFSEITTLLGRKVRRKTTAQIINELDVL